MKYIELKERSKEEILNYLLDKQLENIMIIKDLLKILHESDKE